MIRQSTLVFDIDSQRPPVPGCGGSVGNELSTENRTPVVSELLHPVFSAANTSLLRSVTVTLPTPHKSCILQEPDGCITTTVLCPEIPEPGLSKMDSLISVLNDHHGITYFRQFLANKHASDILEFWLACVGYRKIDADKCSSFAMVIYKTFVAATSNRVCLAGSTRRAIKERLKSGNIDHTMFDSAIMEVETLLLRDYYPLFLESDGYAEYIRTRSANQSPSSDGSSGHSSKCSQLPTVVRNDGQDCSDVKPCRGDCSGCKTAKDPTTLPRIPQNLHCAGDCLAETGYVFIVCHHA